jgi:hypothetical protein
MASPQQESGDADADLVAAALRHCRRCHGRVELRRARWEPPGRLTLHTDVGVSVYFVRSRFTGSALFMAQELDAAGWPGEGLYREELLTCRQRGRQVLVCPAVRSADGALAPPIAPWLDRAAPRTRIALADTAARGIDRFMRVRPGRCTIEAEESDLAFRHASSLPLSSGTRARVAAELKRWRPWVTDLATGMWPRDYYRNLLVGTPGCEGATVHALTLIDFGESQKHGPRADLVAAIALYVAAGGIGRARQAWLRRLITLVLPSPAELAPFPLFLALWMLRWTSWTRSGPFSDEAALSLMRARPAESPDVAAGYLLTLR